MKKHLSISKSIIINANAEQIFKVLIDIENWNLWTKSIDKISIIDNSPFELGTKAKVYQPKISPIIWEVTAIEKNKSFAWINKSFGLKMTANHIIEPQNNGKCLVELEMIYEGFLANFLFGLTSPLASEYMTMEINGLKTKCEKLSV